MSKCAFSPLSGFVPIRRTPVRALPRRWVWLWLLLLVAGCEFKGGQVGEGGLAEQSDAWQPRAEALRVHPTTRFVHREGEPVMLQARVEFFDAMGDSIKGVGSYRLELFTSDELGREIGQRLYQWQIDVHSLAEQRTYFDTVTRSYLFRLRLDDAAPPTRPTLLRVTFLPARSGKRLENTKVLRPTS